LRLAARGLRASSPLPGPTLVPARRSEYHADFDPLFPDVRESRGPSPAPAMGKAPAVRLIPAIVWHPVDAPGTTLDERLLRLLAAIGRHAPLRAAAAATGLSYRAAWGLLADTARLLGVSLVELHQGRGARLTPAGRQLLDANERLLQRLQNESVAIHLPLDKAAPRRAPGRPPLTISASHDLLLAAFCEQWARPE